MVLEMILEESPPGGTICICVDDDCHFVTFSSRR